MRLIARETTGPSVRSPVPGRHGLDLSLLQLNQRCAKQESRVEVMSQDMWRTGRGSVPRMFISLSSSVSDFLTPLEDRLGHTLRKI